MCLGVKQLAQYCETGGAVDSMKEEWIIINCLFLYRSKASANGKQLLRVVVHVILNEAEVLTNKWLLDFQYAHHLSIWDERTRNVGIQFIVDYPFINKFINNPSVKH